MKKLLISSFIFINVACATQQKYIEQVKTWKGETSDSVIHAWGIPDEQKELPSGNKVLIYNKTSQYIDQPINWHRGPDETSTYKYNAASDTIQQETYKREAHQPVVYTQTCITSFEIDKMTDRVAHIYIRGDNCVSN